MQIGCFPPPEKRRKTRQEQPKIAIFVALFLRFLPALRLVLSHSVPNFPAVFRVEDNIRPAAWILRDSKSQLKILLKKRSIRGPEIDVEIDVARGVRVLSAAARASPPLPCACVCLGVWGGGRRPLKIW